MKHIIFIALLFCTFSARAQYPTHPTKQELGRQTTGDGLTFRGSGAPAYTPTGKNNAWMFLDTLSGTLYAYRGGSWQLVNAGGVTDVSISNDTLYITTADSTFFAVFDDANTNFANTNLTFTGNRVHNLSTRTLTIADGGTYPTFQQSAATDAISLYSTAKDFAYFTPGLVEMGSDAQLNILADDTITVTASRIRLNAADTRVQQVSKDNALNRVMMIDSLTGRLYYRDVSSIAGGGGTVTGTGTTNTLPKWTSSTALGNSLITDDGTDVAVGGTASFRLPNGTTAQRPGSPLEGMTRYNKSNGVLEYYGASAWQVSTHGSGTSGRVAAFNGTYSLTDAIYSNTIATDHNTPASASLVQVSHGTSNAPAAYTQSSLAVLGPTRGWQLYFSNTSGWVRQWQSGYAAWRQVWMDSNDGAGSGLDADILDGLNSTSFMRSDVYGNTFNVASPAVSQVISAITSSPKANLTPGVHIGNTVGERGFQFAYDGVNSEQLYFRGRWASSYTNWYRLATGYAVAGNIPFWGANFGSAGDTLTNSSNLFWEIANSRLGIGTTTPARSLDAGEVRIRDLTTDAPTRIVGADADGDLGAITVGTGLSLSGGTLSATGGAGTTNLAFSGSSSPVTLTSDTGTDVIFAAGSGIALSQSAGTMTIARTYSLIHATITGGSTFFGTTAERPDNDTPGSATTSAVGSDFSVSGSTVDYTGGNGALIRVEGSISFSVADDGDYYLSLFKEGTEIGATSMRITCTAGNYYSVSLPATTVTGNTNDTFDLRIATVSGNSTTTMHRYGYILERIY